jgi:hypothetical protein
MALSRIIICLVAVSLFAVGCIAPVTLPAESGTMVQEEASQSQPEAALQVDTSTSLGAVSPQFFGTNYGPWVSLRPETLDLAYDSGITVLRWPGGEWGDRNDIRPYQLDQLITLADAMGAEPYIHVRFLGSEPAVAAEVVRYANVEKGYGIRYWAIGNEPSLFEAGGHPWNATAFSEEWRKFAEAMKAVDPSILLLGPETHQFTGTPDVDPVDSQGNDWLRTFLAINGDLVDVVTVHRYPFPNTPERLPATIEGLRADAPRWTEIAQNLRAVTREITGRDLPIGITEFNSHWSQATQGEATPDSHFSAIWLGDILGRLLVERVEFLTQFLLVSGPDNGFGIIGRYGPRPAYYTYQMYKSFGRDLVEATSPVDHVGIYAATRDDGALTILLINLADTPVPMPLMVDGAVATEPSSTLLFDSAHAAEQVDAILVDGVAMLPAQSMTLLIY